MAEVVRRVSTDAGVIALDQASDFPAFDESDDVEPVEESAPRKRRTRADSGKPRAPRATSTTKLAQELAEPIVIIGSMLAMTMPTAGTVVSVRAEETAKALVKMAEKRPKMLAALKRMSEVGPAGEIVQTIIMVVIAAQIDAERARPDSVIAQAVGVTPIWMELNQALQDVRSEMPEPSPMNDGGFGNFDMPAPPDIAGYDEDGIFTAPPMFTAGKGAGSRN